MRVGRRQPADRARFSRRRLEGVLAVAREQPLRWRVQNGRPGPGLRRRTNQDSAFASGRLLAVADGMGGHAGGDVAGSVAIDCLIRMDRSLDAMPIAALDRAVETARQELREKVSRTPALVANAADTLFSYERVYFQALKREVAR